MKPVLPLALLLLPAGAACAPSGYHRLRQEPPPQPGSAAFEMIRGDWTFRLEVQEGDEIVLNTVARIQFMPDGRYEEETVVTIAMDDGPLSMRQRSKGEWRHLGKWLHIGPESTVSTPLRPDSLTPAQKALAKKAKAHFETPPPGGLHSVLVQSLTPERMETRRRDGIRSICLRPGKG